MSCGILGKKMGMTQIFNEDGSAVPVTVIEAGPCIVLQKKTSEKDGYSSIQIGFEEMKPKNLSNALVKHFEKAQSKPMRFIKEIRLADDEEVNKYELGQEITCEIFEKGQYVDVIGTSKGKGYAGVMKRHNFRGGKASHGVHEFYRHGGSIGQCATPSRVFKGVKMPGRMGNARVSIKKLEIIDIQKEKNCLLVKGSVPGKRTNYVTVMPTNRK